MNELDEIQQYMQNTIDYPLITQEEIKYALKIIDRPYLFKEILAFWLNS